jgi:predicted DNA-binding protein with PD1-like motif
MMEVGDEVVESLRRFASESGIRSGFFAGLGAANDIQLAFYDLDRKEYLRRDFPEFHEIGSLTGNLTFLNGQPFVHAHAVVGGRDYAARTGHLMRARCSATVEIFVHDFEAEIHRGPVPELGLSLWRL